jgi:predicted helicase
MEFREDKLSFLAANNLSAIQFETLQPDRKQNWLNLTNNDWESLLPLADKKSKFWTRPSQDKAIFRLVSNGLQTKEG